MSCLYVPILAALDFVTPPPPQVVRGQVPRSPRNFRRGFNLDQKFARSSQEVAKVRRKLQKFAGSCLNVLCC